METGFVENIKLNYGLTQSSFGLGLKGVGLDNSTANAINIHHWF